MAVAMNIFAFMQAPRQMEWEAAITEGWPGPDGSSASTDHIMGVRIGVTSPEYEHHELPANRHDWRYHLGRTYCLPEGHRRAADVAYRKDCIETVGDALDGKTMILLGTLRAWARYIVLRWFGKPAWTA